MEEFGLLASPVNPLRPRAIISINCSIGHNPAQVLVFCSRFCGRFFGRLILHQDIFNFLQRSRPGLWG